MEKILRIKKKFDYKGLELRIVSREEPYMNSKSPIIMTRVLAPNGGVIPVVIKRGQTLKSIQAVTEAMLNSLKKRGADVKSELTREL
jgi:hypothetical protein